MSEDNAKSPVSSSFAEDYRALFGQQWAPWVGGLLLSAIDVMMFVYSKAWNITEGLRN